MKKILDKDELNILREGLLKKLSEFRVQYGKISHRTKFDILVSKNNYKKVLKRNGTNSKKFR